MKTLKHLERVKKLTAEQRQRLALRLEQRQAQDGNGQRLLAYLVARPGVPTSEEEIRDFAGKKMPEYMVPSAFVFLESLPLLPNGTVDRKALPALAQEGGFGWLARTIRVLFVRIVAAALSRRWRGRARYAPRKMGGRGMGEEWGGDVLTGTP